MVISYIPSVCTRIYPSFIFFYPPLYSIPRNKKEYIQHNMKHVYYGIILMA